MNNIQFFALIAFTLLIIVTINIKEILKMQKQTYKVKNEWRINSNFEYNDYIRR